MPQLIPIAVAAAVSYAASRSGRKNKKAASEAERRAYEMATKSGEAGLQRAGEISPYTTGMLDLAKKGYQPAFDYWSGILSGDRSEMTSVLAPEIGRIGEGYTQARRETSQFAPRGGGRASTLGNIPFQHAQDVSELFSKLRPLAAQSLGQLAGEAGRTGTGTGFLEANLMGMPISAAGTMLGPAIQSQQNWWNRVMAGAQGGANIGSWLGGQLGAGTKGGGSSGGVNFGETGATGGQYGVYP